MILVISQRKRIAKTFAESFHYMSVLSYGTSPSEGLSEISELYRAILIVNPEELPDVSDYIRRVRSYKKDILIFAVSLNNNADGYTEYFDKVFDSRAMTSTIANSIIKYANEKEYACIGNYKLCGINASWNSFGVRYFSYNVELTRTEAMILRYLIRSYPLPKGSTEILKYAFRESRMPECGSVRTHISMINRKFYELTKRRMITLVQGEGYVILTPELISKNNCKETNVRLI